MKKRKGWKSKIFVFLTIIAFVVTAMYAGLGMPTSAGPDLGEAILEEETVEIVTLELSTKEATEKVVELGIDIAAIHEKDDGMEVEVVVTPSEIKMLEDLGIKVSETLMIEQEKSISVPEQRRSMMMTTVDDDVKILRADYFTNQSATFLYVEAKSSEGSSASTALTATWTEGGEEKSASLSRRTDYGEYLYHLMELPVEEIPSTVTVESNLGGTATSKVTEWLGADLPEPGDHYVSEFIDSYMTPIELDEKMDQLAEEFPDLVEIIEMPHETNGYRRHAQATMGGFTNTAVSVTSNDWGHEGGNDIEVEFVDPGTEDASLQLTIENNLISVELATNSTGGLTSTASDVVDILNDQASDLVSAATYRGNSGTGTAQLWSSTLSDGLSAPEYVSRDPQTVRVIRIGKDRDGSNPGVLAYSQEHAREWVTPLVTIETAERLLRNYAHDSDTKKLVNNLDIFLIPSVNPDGANYSFYDFNLQRKNMTNYCGPGEASDYGARNNWGVDLNRNHSVGSIWDGFVGASSSCTSGSYSGPAINSEPEAQNLVWLGEEFTNLEFGMNIHSHGGYFLWSPGAYDQTRTTLPRPSAGEEAYYWQASEQILSRIQQHRGTAIRPTRTGPIPDVLYSAAGNSADYFWYEQDIYTWNFEVGAQLWNGNNWVSTGFQPDYETEGHDQALEFSNGLIGLFEVALDYAQDNKKPKSSAEPGSGKYSEPVDVTFETSEPATIYYTLDGSRPNFESDQLQLAGTREGPETLKIEETTTINFFSVDIAGNVEKNYKPDGNGKNYNSMQLSFEDLDGSKNSRGKGNGPPAHAKAN